MESDADGPEATADPLTEYVRSCLDQGYSADSVKECLLASGYDAATVEHVLSSEGRERASKDTTSTTTGDEGDGMMEPFAWNYTIIIAIVLSFVWFVLVGVVYTVAIFHANTEGTVADVTIYDAGDLTGDDITVDLVVGESYIVYLVPDTLVDGFSVDVEITDLKDNTTVHKDSITYAYRSSWASFIPMFFLHLFDTMLGIDGTNVVTARITASSTRYRIDHVIGEVVENDVEDRVGVLRLKMERPPPHLLKDTWRTLLIPLELFGLPFIILAPFLVPRLVRWWLGEQWKYYRPILEGNIFLWDKVPGDGDQRIETYLRSNLGLTWADDTTIEKSVDGNTIRIYPWQLFSWKNLPGCGEDLMHDFISEKLELEWIYDAKPVRSADGRTVRLAEGEEWVELALDEAGDVVVVRTHDKRILELAVKRERLLFGWGQVPGDREIELQQYLIERLGMDWVDAARIRKTKDGQAIRMSSKDKWAEIRIDEEWKKASLITSDGVTRP
ncbi:MAG: hypothetical protein QGG50_06440, partial [Methanopyri archaeon]|nr:hypothetical protein [Methanopyri archaeon]